jgi:hypothetical protein
VVNGVVDMTCYRITESLSRDIALFCLARSVDECREKIRPYADKAEISVDRLGFQDFCSPDLESLVANGAWSGLLVNDRLAVLLMTFSDTLKIIGRVSDLMDIEVAMLKVEKGLV